MAQEILIGIDVGTSSIKAVAVDPAGRLVSDASSPMKVAVERPGWSEQHPEDWWRGTCEVLREIIDSLDEPIVLGVGLSGQMHSLVALDETLTPVRPAILWNDVRNSEQVERVRNLVAADQLLALTGNPALEGFTATKLMWMRDNEPELFSKVRKFCLAKDYIRLLLTGELRVEPSDASGTLVFDVAGSKKSSEMFDLLDLGSELLPDLVGSSELAGIITPEASSQTGVPIGVPVVGGGADNACAAVGAGVTRQGTGLVSVGTSGTLVIPSDTAVADPGMSIHLMRNATPDNWYLMGVVLSAGAALNWWRTVSGESDFESLVADAAETEIGAGGVTFLPYLSGERTPHADANARGTFIGMNVGTTRGHMTRAVIEGVTFALKDSFDLMGTMGVVPDHATAVGGGANSEFWLQMMSDAFGLPLESVGPAEGAPLGAAMLAAVGADVFETVEDAASLWLTSEKRVEPDSTATSLYAEEHSKYQELYADLKQTFADRA